MVKVKIDTHDTYIHTIYIDKCHRQAWDWRIFHRLLLLLLQRHGKPCIFSELSSVACNRHGSIGEEISPVPLSDTHWTSLRISFRLILPTTQLQNRIRINFENIRIIAKSMDRSKDREYLNLDQKKREINSGNNLGSDDKLWVSNLSGWASWDAFILINLI